jgi:succinate-acetate transporter protein
MSAKDANPAPLGLACFALTTFLLSTLNAELSPQDVIGPIVSAALIYGGVIQVMAGMWEIRKGSTFGGVAFSSYGGFWMSLGLIFLLDSLGIWPVSQGALGVFLFAWTLFTFYLWVATFRINKALTSTFALLLLTFVLLDIGHLAGIANANVAGGYTGILCALNAWYVSAAMLLNELFKREVLPLGHTD